MAIDLIDVAAGVGGFVILGEKNRDASGFEVANAGDVNGDGYDDIVIGAPHADGDNEQATSAGAAYVVYGKAGGFAATIDLTDVAAGIGGFVVHGEELDDFAGISVSTAGDINGDGLADILIGANHGAGPDNTREYAGNAYVVFGSTTLAPVIHLTDVANGIGGFVMWGQDQHDLTGRDVSTAGDVNGDGFDDFIVSARHAEKGPGVEDGSTGDTYIVFGSGDPYPPAIDFADIENGVGNHGFMLHGIDDHDETSLAITSGDVNGDGYDDIITCSRYADGPTNASEKCGEIYVVFGHAGAFAPATDLTDIAQGIGGFVIYGDPTGTVFAQPKPGGPLFVPRGTGDQIGWACSTGDVNGDGISDIIISARYADGPGDTRDRAGGGYVVFGHTGDFPTAVQLTGDDTGNTPGFAIYGEDVDDLTGWSISTAGDINGDGCDDFLMGGRHGDGPGNTREDAGDIYVVFGSTAGFPDAIDLTDVAQGNGGFLVFGEESFGTIGDEAGFSVSSAGDINGDGYDDLIIGAPDASDSAGKSYVLFGSATVGGSADHVTHQGTAGADQITGDGSANDIIGGQGSDVIKSNGGADVVRGASGDDTIFVSDASFQHIAGGTGVDILAFSGGITLVDDDFHRISEVESMKLGDGATSLTLGPIAAHAFDGLAANHFRLLIQGGKATNSTVDIDASAYTQDLVIDLGRDAQAVTLSGGLGNDKLTGGKTGDDLSGGLGRDVINGGDGDDLIEGGGAKDTLRGEVGVDTFVYHAASDSTSTGYDHVIGFNATIDKFDVGGSVTGVDSPVRTGSLSQASFDADLAAALTPAKLGAHHAASFNVTAGSLAGQVFLVIDMNGVAGYQAGADVVVHLDQVAKLGNLDLADFV
jgi:hypothetical protein